MPRTIRIASVFAAVAFAAVAVVSSSSAAEMRWGAQVFGSYDTHAMDDWNNVIDQANTSGSNFNNIHSGMAFGAGPVVTVNDSWQFGAHFERLMAKKSEDSGTEVKPVANAFGLSVGYLFPSHSPLNMGLFASFDDYTLASTVSDPTASNDVKGSGIGFSFGGTTNYAFSPMFAGNFSLGYRAADIKVDTIGGVDATGSPLSSENYSGVVARLGITLQQPRK